MARYVAGDDRAFAELYELLAPRLRAYLLRRTRDVTRAEDLLQHVFLKMHLARRQFWNDADVTPWAFAIARRLLIDGFRVQCRECLMDAEGVRRLGRRPATGPRLDELIGHRDLVLRLERELASLPVNHRVAFELVQLEGLTLAEAAQTLGTTVNAIKCRTHRAYRALRERLGAAVVDAL
jgi:RNA polymerase sigma-70 factor, ECF subfamily